MTEQEFKRLKTSVEADRAAAERSRGALNQLMSDLKETYDCNTLKEAKAMLEEKQAELAKSEKELDRVVAEYQKKWHPDAD